jgi:hypothetical protein
MRSPAPRAIVPPVSTGDPLRLSIDVVRSVTPVSGTVATAGGAARAFAGWTELFAALQAIIVNDRPEGDPDAQNI